MSDDGYPRLTTKLESHAIARTDGYVLKGGLGCLGVGQMWFEIGPGDPDYSHLPYVNPQDVWGRSKPSGTKCSADADCNNSGDA